MKDTLNHQIYADRIAEEIVKHYEGEVDKEEDSRENIVFAISGKWGEGKTDLLNRIEKPLISKRFTVVKFNPWKYSQDEVTIKRAFLKEVKRELKSAVSLDDLYYDKSETSIEWRKLTNYWKKLPWFWIIFIGLILLVCIPLIFNFSYSWWLGLLFTPFKQPAINGALLGLTTLFIIKKISSQLAAGLDGQLG